MPFRTARIHPAALAGAWLALAAGCAGPGAPVAPGETPAVDVAPQEPAAARPAAELPLVAWEAIDGGFEGLNQFTGSAFVRFRRPVAVAAQGTDIYVADAGRETLYRVDRGVGTLSIVLDLRTALVGEPSDLYVAPDRSFYIADPVGRQVLYFDAEGTLLRRLADALNLAEPVAIVVDEHAGRVYVADGLYDHVLAFDRFGNLLGAIGERGDGPGQFRMINALAQGPDGLYVAARMGERLQLMGLDGSLRHVIDADALIFPTALAVDPSGLVLVSDFHDNTIKLYRGQTYLGAYGGTGGMLGRFRHITDLSLDRGVVYVADSLNGRIQVLRLTPDAPGDRR